MTPLPTSSSQSPPSHDSDWDLVIRPKRHLLDINLRELWEYRELLRMFVKRDIVTIYKQTILGPIWYFIQPLMTMLVYIMVFGNIAKIPTDGIPKSLFYLAGIIMWNYFAECFNLTSKTFLSNANIFGKVYFPRLILPIANVTAGLIRFVIQSLLFFALFFYFLCNTTTIEPNAFILLTPVFVILIAGIGLGSGIIFSALTAKYRDLTFLISFAIQLLMYATPIIYPMSTLPEKYRLLIWINPMTHLIEGFKYAFLGAGSLTFAGLTYSAIFTFLLLFFGVIIFNKTEQNFMDTI